MYLTIALDERVNMQIVNNLCSFTHILFLFALSIFPRSIRSHTLINIQVFKKTILLIWFMVSFLPITTMPRLNEYGLNSRNTKVVQTLHAWHYNNVGEYDHKRYLG